MPRGQARRTMLSRVEDMKWARKPALALTTRSERTLIANKDLRLLSYSGTWSLTWRKLETLIRPYREGKRAALANWVSPWQPRSDFESGWLSGMYDGEGSLTKRTRNGNSLVLAITQNAGPLMEHVKELLSADGFDFNYYPQNGKKTTFNLGLKGGTREYLRFLGSYRPRRLLTKLMSSDCDLELWLSPDPVVDVTAVGMKDMVELRTSEGTHFANGFAVHNRQSDQSDQAQAA
jgi:hypothetical protein